MHRGTFLRVSHGAGERGFSREVYRLDVKVMHRGTQLLRRIVKREGLVFRAQSLLYQSTLGSTAIKKKKKKKKKNAPGS